MLFNREKFSDIKDEILPIWQKHYEELAVHKDIIPLSPNYELYELFEKANILYIVTVRNEKTKELCGYYFFYTGPHLHYSTTQFAYTDIYYLLPQFRYGFTGVKLIKEACKYAKEVGAIKLQTGTKIHMGPKISKLFTILGFEETDIVHSKVL